MACFQSVQ